MTHSSLGAPHPRSVFVADDRLYREIAQSPDYVELLEDTEAIIVPYSAPPEGNEVQVRVVRDLLVAAGQLVTGALLIKNPYDDDLYAYADDALETFASAKYHHLANVARLLGAKEVNFIEAKVERETGRAEAALRALIPGLAGGEVDVTHEVARKLEDRLQGQMKFPGSEPALDDAVEYVRRRHLTNDHQIQALVDMRRGNNSLRQYKMSLSASRESDVNLKSAAKISSKIPTKAIDIGASFAQRAESFRNIEITTEITF